MKQSEVKNYSLLRYVFNMFFAYLQQTLLKQKVYDLGAFVGFNLNTVKHLPYRSITFDMGYHPHLILLASRFKTLSFVEFPIYWGRVEHTSVNVWKYGIIHLGRILKLQCGLYPRRNFDESIKTRTVEF